MADLANVCPDDPAMEIWEGPPGRIEWSNPTRLVTRSTG
jgi:hypothetical protein